MAKRKRKHRSGNGRRVGISAVDELRLRRRLRKLAPSEPWVDAQFTSFTDTDARGEEISYRFHDAKVFPPGGEKTAMVRCKRCGVFTPPYALEQRTCLDHSDHRGWGESPSAKAIRALQHLNLRMTESTLAPESTAALRREIAAHERGTGKAAKAGRPAGTRRTGKTEGKMLATPLNPKRRRNGITGDMHGGTASETGSA